MEPQNDELNQEAINGIQMRLQDFPESSSVKECFRELEQLICDWEIDLDSRRKDIGRRRLLPSSDKLELDQQLEELELLERRIEELKFLREYAFQNLGPREF